MKITLSKKKIFIPEEMQSKCLKTMKYLSLNRMQNKYHILGNFNPRWWCKITVLDYDLFILGEKLK